jgi:hypothetical protein
VNAQRAWDADARGLGRKKPDNWRNIVTVYPSQDAIAKADELATLTGLSRTKAITAALEVMDPRTTARQHIERHIAEEGKSA